MPDIPDERAQGLQGKLITDYLEIHCIKCDGRIQHLVFYGIDAVGVKLLAQCDKCDFNYIFKLRTKPMLGQIQLTKNLGRTSYKTYDKRRLSKRLKEIGHPHISRER